MIKVIVYCIKLILIMQAESIVLTQSPNDKRQYEALVLPNQLKVIFIHDQEIAKSACSISVGVGSLYDKDRSLGLAHFLQHMLFMGSKKYPSHNEYSSFISTNSGYDNAYTSDVETNYYFEVQNSAFNEAVERLTNFFTGALLVADCIEKESQAVHEEFVLWTNDDNCRKWEVLRKLASGPYSRFSIGNTETLRHEYIRDDLVEFYEKYYSSNIITAVVCSNYSIKDMKDVLIPFLQVIPNKNVQLPEFDLHFRNNQTGKFVRMQSIKDEANMEFFWIVENLRPKYKKHLQDYFNYVVGYEGKNSLLSILKNRKYASSLMSYPYHLKTQTMLCADIKLTELGEEDYEEVYNIVMDFMSSLKAEKFIFEEIKAKKLIDFEFKEKERVSDYVTDLTSKMHHIPLPEILNYTVLFQDYNETEINKILSQLNPFNAIVVFSNSDELQNPLKQKYLGANYLICDLPQRKKSNIDFKPIPPNPYIPVDSKLHGKTQGQSEVVPTKVRDNIYFLYNSSFRVCKGGIELRIYTAHSNAFTELYSVYLKLLLKEVTYPAEALECKIEYDTDDCLIITIFGFSDVVLKMLANIATHLHIGDESHESQALFEVALHQQIETYENFYNEESNDVADCLLDILLTQDYDSIDKIIEELKGYNLKNVNQQIKKFWSINKLKWIVVGNFDKDSVVDLIEKAQTKLKGDESKLKLPQSGCLKLSGNVMNEAFLQSEELSSSCALVYFQGGPYTEELYYKLLLLKNYVDEPYFNQLRTQKQMAYYLSAQTENRRGILGLKFNLVSSTRDPKNISEEIKNFVLGFFAKMEQDLAAENSEKFQRIKQSVFTRLISPHNNLEALFEFISKEINEKTYYYTRKEQSQIKKYLDPITINDLKETWERIKNKTLDIYIVSKAHEQAYNKYQLECEEVEAIKEKSGFWGDVLQCE